MPLPPYVEAPVIRTTAQPVSGGIDTSGYDRFRQGVSLRGDSDKEKSSQPKAIGWNDGVIDHLTFGQPKEHFDDVAYLDTIEGVFDPVAFIENPNGIYFPEINSSSGYRDPERPDGFIEPFSIAARASLASIADPFEIHDVRGQLQDGNEDALKRVDRILQFVEDRSQPSTEFYEDSQEEFGIGEGAIAMPGIISDAERVIQPFEENHREKSNVILKREEQGIEISGEDMRSALIAMDPADDDLRPSRHLSSTAGWTYDNNRVGTDSLAFGGLLR